MGQLERILHLYTNVQSAKINYDHVVTSAVKKTMKIIRDLILVLNLAKLIDLTGRYSSRSFVAKGNNLFGILHTLLTMRLEIVETSLLD